MNVFITERSKVKSLSGQLCSFTALTLFRKCPVVPDDSGSATNCCEESEVQKEAWCKVQRAASGSNLFLAVLLFQAAAAASPS